MTDLFEGQRTAPADVPRPTERTPEVMLRVVQDMTPDVITWMGSKPRDPGYVTADLLRALQASSYDGFDLARYLDRHGWDGVDAQLVEILDSASSHAYTARQDAVRAWALGQGDALTFPIGAVVQTRQGRGAIVHRDHDQLTYGVRLPDMPANSWAIIPYEQCSLAPEGQS